MYEQRVRFILEVQQRTFSFAESCRRYSISRAAGYLWWKRFLAEGFEGPVNRPTSYRSSESWRGGDPRMVRQEARLQIPSLESWFNANAV